MGRLRVVASEGGGGGLDDTLAFVAGRDFVALWDESNHSTDVSFGPQEYDLRTDEALMDFLSSQIEDMLD